MPVVDARVVMVWAVNGTAAVNTAKIRYDDAVTETQGVADAIRDAFQTHILSELSNECVLQEVKVGDDVMGAVSLSGQAGGNADSSLPPNCSYGITKVTNSGRNGRWFLPGVPEPNVDGSGRVNPPAQAALNAKMALMLADVEAAGGDFRITQAAGGDVQIDQFSVRPFITRQSRRLDRARGF